MHTMGILRRFQIFYSRNDTTTRYRDTAQNALTNLTCQTRKYRPVKCQASLVFSAWFSSGFLYDTQCFKNFRKNIVLMQILLRFQIFKPNEDVAVRYRNVTQNRSG